MLVAVACGKCGKPFQVEDSAVGTTVACPWCAAAVPALPVATPVSPAPTPAPLSLDQAVQLPSEPTPAPRPVPTSPGKLLARLFLLGAAMAVAGFGGWYGSRYGGGKLPDGAWREVAPPGGECRVKLPGEPVEETIPADPKFPGVLGGKRFVARRWFEQVTVAVGWLDIDPLFVKRIHDDSLIASERERRAVELGGKATPRGDGRVGAYTSQDVEYETPAGPVFERFVAALGGPTPRLYVVTVGGPKVTLKGEAGKPSPVETAFASLWLNDPGK